MIRIQSQTTRRMNFRNMIISFYTVVFDRSALLLGFTTLTMVVTNLEVSKCESHFGSLSLFHRNMIINIYLSFILFFFFLFLRNVRVFVLVVVQGPCSVAKLIQNRLNTDPILSRYIVVFVQAKQLIFQLLLLFCLLRCVVSTYSKLRLGRMIE
jgi:hypothetical protein